MKTVNVEEETWGALHRRKLDTKASSLDEVIIAMLNRIKMQDEMAKHIAVTGVRKK